MQGDELSVESAPAPGRRPVPEPVTAELAAAARRQTQERCQTGRDRAEAESTRRGEDARRKRDDEHVLQRRKRVRVARKTLRQPQDACREQMWKRLIAPPDRVSERPLGDPGVEERLSVREALTQPLGGCEMEDRIVERHPTDPELGSQIRRVEDEGGRQQYPADHLLAASAGRRSCAG